MKRYAEYKDSGIPWLGDIPSEWIINRGKEILTLLERPVKDDDDVITCFRDGEVTLRKNRREEGFTISMKEVGYQGIEPGDLVVHGMDGFAGSIGVSDSRGKATPVLNVMDSKQNKRFLMYYLRMAAYRDVFMSLSTGIRVRSCDLRWNKLAVFPFLVPPIDEQNRIADYIDKNIKYIDSLIDEAKASIEEYKELKQAVIDECVNNRNKKIKVKYLGKVQTGPFGTQLSADEYTTEGVPCINVKNIGYGFIKNENIDYLPQDVVDRLSEHQLFENDIVFARKGSIDKHAIVSEREHGWMQGSDCIRLRLNLKIVLANYINYYLSSSIVNRYLQDNSNGATMASLNSDMIKNIPIEVPDLKKQEDIVNKLDTELKRFDFLIFEKQALIEDLQAYKKSLIYEVVTGKRKVV